MSLAKTLSAALLGAALLATPLAAQNTFGPLISAKELSAIQAGVTPLVLDIRGRAYDRAHIPGAVSAPYGLFRGPRDNPGQLVPEDKLEATLQSLGITKDRRIVIVHEGANETDFGAAARVYWTLKSSGVSQLAILNGGLKGWSAAGLKTTNEPTQPAPSRIDISFADTWLATTDDVLSIVSGQTDALLLDARPESFWKGDRAHPAAARPGTLPQSEYFEHANWFSGGPAIIDADAAAKLAAAQGFDETETLVSFCNTGHWAATNWFALSELAGLENVKLYPESMVGYSNAGHEMANVPSLLRNLYNQIRSIF
ncbi:MAG: sulfurtransferase [Paracoccaceae bacterium]